MVEDPINSDMDSNLQPQYVTTAVARLTHWLIKGHPQTSNQAIIAKGLNMSERHGRTKCGTLIASNMRNTYLKGLRYSVLSIYAVCRQYVTCSYLTLTIKTRVKA